MNYNSVLYDSLTVLRLLYLCYVKVLMSYKFNQLKVLTVDSCPSVFHLNPDMIIKHVELNYVFC